MYTPTNPANPAALPAHAAHYRREEEGAVEPTGKEITTVLQKFSRPIYLQSTNIRGFLNGVCHIATVAQSYEMVKRLLKGIVGERFRCFFVVDFYINGSKILCTNMQEQIQSAVF